MLDTEFEKIARQVIIRARNHGPNMENSANEALRRAQNLFKLTPEEVEEKFREQLARAENEGLA